MFDLSFYYDTKGAPDITPRQYELGVFRLEQKFVGSEDVDLFFKGKRKGWLPKLIPSGADQYKIVRQAGDYAFDESYLMTQGEIYLDGYWQSEKYFAEIEGIIRRELIIQPAAVSKCSVAASLQGSQSVSLHVRRGDYVHNPIVRNVHPVCSATYYDQAVKYIAERVSNPHFFIFSDDIAWCRENLNFSYPVNFVTHQYPVENYLDMYLMSKCCHHIIANSSYSWWGAWLNSNPDKIVVAPHQWFSDPRLSSADIVPAGWVKL